MSESMRDTVASLLAEAGMAHDGALGRALESLRALCPPEAPEPSGPLAELLAAGPGSPSPLRLGASTRAGSRAAEEALGRLGAPADSAVVRFAPRKRHRGAMISAVVVAGVGLSASGVAAGGGIDYSTGVQRADAGSVSAPLGAASEPQPAAGEASLGDGASSTVGSSTTGGAGSWARTAVVGQAQAHHGADLNAESHASQGRGERAEDAVAIDPAVFVASDRVARPRGGAGRHAAVAVQSLDEPDTAPTAVAVSSVSAAVARPRMNAKTPGSARADNEQAGTRGRHL